MISNESISYEKTKMIDPEDQLEEREEREEIDHSGKKCASPERSWFILSLVLGLICLYYLSIYYIANMPHTEDLEARFIRHTHNKRLTCENVHERLPEFYGCCDVVDENGQRFKTSVRRTLKRDEEGSNCPSYHSILLKAQIYYNDYEDYFQSKYEKPKDHNCVKAGLSFPFIHCPSTQEIIIKYDLYFPSPYEDYYVILILIVIIACFLFNFESRKR